MVISCKVSKFIENCDTVITYLENDVSVIFVHFSRNPILCIPSCCVIINSSCAGKHVISIRDRSFCISCDY